LLTLIGENALPKRKVVVSWADAENGGSATAAASTSALVYVVVIVIVSAPVDGKILMIEQRWDWF
jgi:hypothetical protein